MDQYEMLQDIAKMAMNDDHLLSMLVEWNDTQDWGMQDLVYSKILRYYKDKKEENETNKSWA